MDNVTPTTMPDTEATHIVPVQIVEPISSNTSNSTPMSQPTDISPSGSLNAVEWKRNIRDILILLLSLLPSAITQAQGMNWGPYAPVINTVLGIVLVILNRRYNVARVAA